MRTRQARRGPVLAVTGAMLAILVGTTPTFAADNGTVDAQVTVEQAAACIELSTSAISFGTLALGAENAAGTPGITVTNCGDADATILASGTGATGTAAAWNLVDSTETCADTLGTDNYHLDVAAAGGSTLARLSTENKELGTLAGAATTNHEARISMACPGSSGAGQSMSMQITYLATNVVTPPIVLEEIPATQVNADAVAAYVAPATRDYDTPASCAGDPTIACPGGVPSNPLPQIRIQASNVVSVQVPATTQWNASATLAGATLQGIPVTYSGVSCTATFDSSLGASPTFNATATMTFLNYPGGGPTNYVAVANANITGVETADVDLTGGLSCDLLAAFASVFVPMLEDQIAAYLNGNICADPNSASFMPCPVLP